MQHTILIIHGWNDTSASFEALMDRLRQVYPQTVVEEIRFVNYASKEDSLTFSMIATALNDRMIERGFIDKNNQALKNLYVIVHSTGALVIRKWIAMYYGSASDRCPIKKIVMLAPANFGSPWAHYGRSFLGRMFKGDRDRENFGEVGVNLLKGLELASPFQWKLAHEDLLLSSEEVYFTAEKIQVTVLVGLDDNIDNFWGNLASKMLIKRGTDNTVLIAGTALNTIKFEMDYTPAKPTLTIRDSFTGFAFGLLQDTNHHNIRDKVADTQNVAYQYLKRALDMDSPCRFIQFSEELNKQNENLYYLSGKYQPYQLFIIHVIDRSGDSIEDFHIDFCVLEDNDSRSEIPNSGFVYQEFFKITHDNRTDASFRSFLVNITDMRKVLERIDSLYSHNYRLAMKIYIHSNMSETDDEKYVVLYDKKRHYSKSFLYPNTTTFIEVKVNRIVDEKYVCIK